jgi:hypothetical protein
LSEWNSPNNEEAYRDWWTVRPCVRPLPLHRLFSVQTQTRPGTLTKSKFWCLIGHSVLAMTTSQNNEPCPLDVLITQPKPSGLTAPSVVRMKLFTLDHRLILKKLEPGPK